MRNDKRNCFGTNEFSLNQAICLKCKDYNGCKKVLPKAPKPVRKRAPKHMVLDRIPDNENGNTKG